MKTTEILKFVLLAFVVMGFFSCDDDDDKIRFYTYEVFSEKIVELEVGTIYGNEEFSYAIVRGGTAPYTAVSSNQAVIQNDEIRVGNLSGESQNTLIFKIISAGETIITVTDSKGNTADLKVTVKLSSYLYTVGKSELMVNEEVDESVKNEINADIAQSNLVEGNSFKLVYMADGTRNLIVYSDVQAANEKWTGTFWYESHDLGDGLSEHRLVLSYDGKNHSYWMLYGELAKRISDQQQTKWIFVENLTEEYQSSYPSVTDVQYGFNVTYLHNNNN